MEQSRRTTLLVDGIVSVGEKDDLFSNNPMLAEQIVSQTGQLVFDVTAFTAGYTHKVALLPKVRTESAGRRLSHEIRQRSAQGGEIGQSDAHGRFPIIDFWTIIARQATGAAVRV